MQGRQLAVTSGALIGFASVGILFSVNPLITVGLGGVVFASVFLMRPWFLRLLVAALVMVPTAGFLRSSGTVPVATRLAQDIESGNMANRIEATLLFLIGVYCIGLGRRQLKQVNLIPWLGLFIALAIISTLWSDSAPLTLRRSVEALFISVFALGVGGVYFARRPQGHAEMIRMICCASSVMTAAVLVLSVLRGDFHIANPAWRLGREGIENQIGWVAAVGLLAAWTTRKRNDIWTTKALLWFNLACPALGVLLTKSRETWLGVLAGIFVMELAKPYSIRRRLATVVLVAALLCGLASTSVVQNMWARGASEEDLQSASGRTPLWEAAWPLILSRLWLGHGLGAFWTPETVLKLSSSWSPTSLHNGYLDTVAELGLVGLLLVAAGVSVSLRNAWRLMKHPTQYEVGLALLVLILSFLVINAFGAILEVFNSYPVIAILVYSFFVAERLRQLDSTQPGIGVHRLTL